MSLSHRITSLSRVTIGSSSTSSTSRIRAVVHDDGSRSSSSSMLMRRMTMMRPTSSAGLLVRDHPYQQQHRHHDRRSLSAISMDLLKQLRAQSGAPIVECKKAIQSTMDDNSSSSGDQQLTAALDWLREHGAAKASSKVQGRETKEGLVALVVAPNNKSAALVKVGSETDFASRSPKFVDFVLHVANATLDSGGSRSNSSNNMMIEPDTVHTFTSAEGKSVKDALDETIVAIRENLSVTDAVHVDTSGNGMVVGYVHNRVNSTMAGTAAAVVEVAPLSNDKAVEDDVMQSVGKKLAMHIVASRPAYMTPQDVPADEVEKEKSILMKQIQDEEDAAADSKKKKSKQKPPEIIEKIINGRMRKFYQQVCLTEQPHMIEDQNPKVATVLEKAGIQLMRFKSLSIA